MELVNAMLPGPEQAEYLRTSTDPGAVVMINLLRFREKAAYADGRATDLTGQQAFALYSRLMKPLVEGHGGRFLISAFLDRLIIGSGEMGWHRIGLVEYPSRAVFLEVGADPAVHAAAVHRHAGLEGQLLIASTLETDHRT